MSNLNDLASSMDMLTPLKDSTTPEEIERIFSENKAPPLAEEQVKRIMDNINAGCKDGLATLDGKMSFREATLSEEDQKFFSGIKELHPRPIVTGLVAYMSELEGIEVNEKGAKQSKIDGSLTLVPPLAILEISKVLKNGAIKYGPDNWKGIPIRDHLDHCLRHILLHSLGDSSDSHLTNACCRLLFALELYLLNKKVE